MALASAAGVASAAASATAQLASSAVAETAAAAVASLPPLPPGEAIYDIRAPIPVPFPWAQVILPYLLGIAVLVVGAVLVGGWWRRRLAEQAAAAAKLPPYDPVAAAVIALVRLRRSSCWCAESVKDACEELARIIKVYVREKHGLTLGHAATVSEFITDLGRAGAPTWTIEEVRAVLERCESVEYCRSAVSMAELDTQWETVHAWIADGRLALPSRGGRP